MGNNDNSNGDVENRTQHAMTYSVFFLAFFLSPQHTFTYQRTFSLVYIFFCTICVCACAHVYVFVFFFIFHHRLHPLVLICMRPSFLVNNNIIVIAISKRPIRVGIYSHKCGNLIEFDFPFDIFLLLLSSSSSSSSILSHLTTLSLQKDVIVSENHREIF